MSERTSLRNDPEADRSIGQAPGSAPALLVPVGADRAGEPRGLGVSSIDFKVIAPDGGLLVLENPFHAGGGPPPASAPRAGRVVLRSRGRVRHRGGGRAAHPAAWRFPSGAAPCAARMGLRRRRTWADPDRLHAGRQDGGLLPRGHEGRRHAAAGSGTVARPRHGDVGVRCRWSSGRWRRGPGRYELASRAALAAIASHMYRAIPGWIAS